MSLYIGLMSGTSMDGVDAALIDADKNQLIDGITRPYSPNARQFLEQVLTSPLPGLGTLNQLSTVLANEFALTVKILLQKTNRLAEQIVAIGSHGQTIAHDAAASIPYTVQLGCGHTIAEETGIRVVADFRTRDMVVGGQGAPFAPLYHEVLFAKEIKPLVIVNIGGIANITVLEPTRRAWGFDTGPGNALMDAWIAQHQAVQYDRDGAWAMSGQVIEPLLIEWMADPYFKLPSPKSIGKEYFSLTRLMPKDITHYPSNDVQATLKQFTAKTIANAIVDSVKCSADVIVCGGGVHNRCLMQALQTLLPDRSVTSSAAYGINPDFIEAMMFAWLAEKAIHGIPLDLSAFTGAKKPVVLGVVF